MPVEFPATKDGFMSAAMLLARPETFRLMERSRSRGGLDSEGSYVNSMIRDRRCSQVDGKIYSSCRVEQGCIIWWYRTISYCNGG